MLNNILDRARFLYDRNSDVYIPLHLKPFIENDVSIEDFRNDDIYMSSYLSLDDFDIWHALKTWIDSDDRILPSLSESLLNRRLFQIDVSNEKPGSDTIKELKSKVRSSLNLSSKDVDFLVSSGSISNAAYIAEGKKINILTKNGNVIDITKAADLPNIKAMSKIVRKYYLCWPKNISL